MLVWLGLLYYGPQWFPLRAPYTLEPSWLDGEIPFLPQTAWIYQSLFLLLPLAAWLQTNNESFVRFASGFCLLVLTFSAIFWFYPTELRAPTSQPHLNWGYAHLVAAVDGRRNAFPSLHAALTMFAGYSIARLRKGTAVRIFFSLWIVALLISTLTTKQHIAVDVMVGAISGLLAGILSFRWPCAMRTAQTLKQRSVPNSDQIAANICEDG
jgi:membrane-associated phospholipid phosphatase